MLNPVYLPQRRSLRSTLTGWVPAPIQSNLRSLVLAATIGAGAGLGAIILGDRGGLLGDVALLAGILGVLTLILMAPVDAEGRATNRPAIGPLPVGLGTLLIVFGIMSGQVMMILIGLVIALGGIDWAMRGLLPR